MSRSPAAVVAALFLVASSAVATAAQSSAPSETSAASPLPLHPGRLAPGTYVARPFDPLLGGHECMEPPQAGCTETTANDAITFTFTVPDGWAGSEQAIWSAEAGYLPPGGAGMLIHHGPWLYSDPCRNDEALPDVQVGPTADDYASALADNPLLDVTTPVDVTLSGYAGKYLDLQVPADISGCAYYMPWGPGIYAQGPSHQWHLWILDVDGVRAIVQTYTFPGTSPEDRAELEAIVGSIQISEPSSPVADVAASPLPTIGEAADDGARIVGVDAIDERTRDLTIESPSVGRVKVRLLLPAGFDADPGATWPVLYLLHGAWGNHEDWTNLTDVEALTAPTDLLVVMPDAATDWYADAWNDGAGGPPAWETFHTTELLQLLERNWRAGDERVVAGLSMGGFGAMGYAARHPGMFQGAASYSGVMDITGSEIDNGVAMFGDPVAQADNWKAHNPLDLAPTLKGIPLYVSYGDGEPGPLDAAGDPSPDGLEQWIAPQNDAFVSRLRELDIPVTVDAYGHGKHDWPYWERALHRSLPMLLDALGEEPLASPSPAAPDSTQ